MQFFRRKRYRFFYPAGLISLILLPILGYFYLYQREELQQKYVMEVNFWNPEQFKDIPEFNVSPESIRNFRTITLNGNQSQDLEKLQQAQREIQQMLARKDTINGIHLLYGPKSKYASMIAALNICLKEEAKTDSIRIGWTSYQNNLWVFYFNAYKQPLWRDEVLPSEFAAPKKSRPPLFDFLVLEMHQIQNDFRQAKSFWPAGILYIIMVSLTARKVVRQFRNQQRTTSN